jgi:hypothetical protein
VEYQLPALKQTISGLLPPLEKLERELAGEAGPLGTTECGWPSRRSPVARITVTTPVVLAAWGLKTEKSPDPMHEVAMAGTLPEMLNHIALIGSDLQFRSALASPTVVVEGLTVAGT